MSCAAIAPLVCAFVFAYAKSRFSHDAAQIGPMVFPISRVFAWQNDLGFESDCNLDSH